MDTEKVIEGIKESNALEFGEFELSSGGKSDYYIDKYKFQTHPDTLDVIATAMSNLVDENKLAGVALGAVPLVTAVSIKSSLPYVIVRKKEKEYGTGNLIEGSLEENQNVTVIEDVTTTGNSALNAVEALRNAGANVQEVIVVVDRQQGARELLIENNVELTSLVEADDILE